MSSIYNRGDPVGFSYYLRNGDATTNQVMVRHPEISNGRKLLPSWGWKDEGDGAAGPVAERGRAGSPEEHTPAPLAGA